MRSHSYRASPVLPFFKIVFFPIASVNRPPYPLHYSKHFKSVNNCNKIVTISGVFLFSVYNFRLHYLPRQHLDNGVITSYEVRISTDNGKTCKTVKKGEWSIDASWKVVDFPMVKATDIRLVAVAS